MLQYLYQAMVQGTMVLRLVEVVYSHVSENHSPLDSDVECLQLFG